MHPLSPQRGYETYWKSFSNLGAMLILAGHLIGKRQSLENWRLQAEPCLSEILEPESEWSTDEGQWDPQGPESTDSLRHCGWWEGDPTELHAMGNSLCLSSQPAELFQASSQREFASVSSSPGSGAPGRPWIGWKGCGGLQGSLLRNSNHWAKGVPSRLASEKVFWWFHGVFLLEAPWEKKLYDKIDVFCLDYFLINMCEIYNLISFQRGKRDHCSVEFYEKQLERKRISLLSMHHYAGGHTLM